MRRRVFPLISVLLFATGATGLDAGRANAAPATAADKGSIVGVVQTPQGEPLANALVVLQCNCLEGVREVHTNDAGLYSFLSLPPGTYTVQVLSGKASVSRVFELPAEGRFKANFRVDPRHEFKRTIRVKPQRRQATAGRSIPTSGQAGRDFTQIVDASASASRGAGGVRFSGTTWVEGATEPYSREGYAHLPTNDFLSSVQRPLSTFSVDVDTASYANVRRFIEQGVRPPPGAVRIEELVNDFDYGYVRPKGAKPVTVNWEITHCPWNGDHLLARIGLQTASIADQDVPPRNLVFLLDVSGSMNDPMKLPLLKRALQLLVDNLRPRDKVSIVVYAGQAGVVLEPTSGRHLPTIRHAIADLEPGGSTNGAGGIRMAYKLAKRAFIRNGINRVILATDGDFNVGATSDSALVDLIEAKRESGVFLSVLGFGSGNLQDTKMELLADKSSRSRLLAVPMAGVPKPLAAASDDLRFAAAVAAYGMELRDSPHKGTTSLNLVGRLAKGALGQDTKGYRAEFVELVEATRRIKRSPTPER